MGGGGGYRDAGRQGRRRGPAPRQHGQPDRDAPRQHPRRGDHAAAREPAHGAGHRPRARDPQDDFGRRCRRDLRGRQGPKVNGRDYHHPSFLEVADRYHNEALVAHRMTGRVEVPLPVLARGNPQLVASSQAAAAATSRWQVGTASLSVWQSSTSFPSTPSLEDAGVRLGGARRAAARRRPGSCSDPAAIIASSVSSALALLLGGIDQPGVAQQADALAVQPAKVDRHLLVVGGAVDDEAALVGDRRRSPHR